MKKIIKYIIMIILITITLSTILIGKFIITKEIINQNKVFEYNEKIYLKDLVGIDSNEILDTLTLGEHIYKNETRDKIYNIHYTVKDTTPPLIKGSSSYTIKKGDKIDLVNKMLCGDNYDSNPNCYIQGEYDTNKVGEYNLTYIAQDCNNNTSKKEFKLIVKNTLETKSSTTTKKYIKNIIEEHKNTNNMIGIDVSSWQGNIDYNKAKQDGVEFVMIRIGYGYNKNGKIVYDSKFKDNLKKAKQANLKVGIYLYSYAKNTIEAQEQAQWIINELNGETLDLPIAFDWENWSTFNSYKVSFKELNDIAKSFINEIKENGYDSVLYSSAYYLNNIWYKEEYTNTWMAHYTNKTDYSGKYQMWQLTSSGIVNGINGYVDIDIMYLN